MSRSPIQAPLRAVSSHLCPSSSTPTTAGPPIQTVIWYVADTVLLTLLSGPLHHQSSVLHEFVERCNKSALELNKERTQEMVVNCSSKQRELAAPAATTNTWAQFLAVCLNLLSTLRRSAGDASSGRIS